MYGNRKQICHQLNKLFIGDEPLAVLFWTEASIAEACGQFDPTPEEAIAVLQAVGNIPYERYQAEGVDPARFPDLLSAHRETLTKKVAVPEAWLRVLIDHAGNDIQLQTEMAWQSGMATPFSITRSEYQLNELKALLGPEPATTEDEN
ncbi:DUF1380 family protein [Enterobacter sp.]|uniref:DUF1380 family protein n=1 Tax=Enterobacter sp. TaxID=42895 RepID=UPI00296E29B7|nr:DUF1380 family protein [Enterobacter sp.]